MTQSLFLMISYHLDPIQGLLSSGKSRGGDRRGKGRGSGDFHLLSLFLDQLLHKEYIMCLLEAWVHPHFWRSSCQPGHLGRLLKHIWQLCSCETYCSTQKSLHKDQSGCLAQAPNVKARSSVSSLSAIVLSPTTHLRGKNSGEQFLRIPSESAKSGGESLFILLALILSTNGPISVSVFKCLKDQFDGLIEPSSDTGLSLLNSYCSLTSASQKSGIQFGTK
ncbi:hypothetical protein Q9966_009707 [Columba livia]|nr:hypothetical protein Q9966_009707 [Columba livia]